MKSTYKNKRGQTIGLAFLGLAVVFISISFIFLAFITNEWATIINSNSTDGNFTFEPEARSIANNANDAMPKVLDASFAFFVVISTIMLVATVAFAQGNIIFFAISGASFLFMILGNAVFANLIDEIGNSSVFAATYANLPLMSFFADNWLTFTIVTGFLSIIAFFGGRILK